MNKSRVVVAPNHYATTYTTAINFIQLLFLYYRTILPTLQLNHIYNHNSLLHTQYSILTIYDLSFVIHNLSLTFIIHYSLFTTHHFTSHLLPLTIFTRYLPLSFPTAFSSFFITSCFFQPLTLYLLPSTFYLLPFSLPSFIEPFLTSTEKPKDKFIEKLACLLIVSIFTLLNNNSFITSLITIIAVISV
jgi:hypothetical protein